MLTKENYTAAFLKAADKNPDQENLEKYSKFFWYSFRNKEEGGLRLTEDGFNFVIEYCDLKSYKVDLPKELTFTPQVLLWLDKFIQSPFFITKNTITVFSEKVAFELYLFSGDIRKMGTAKAMAKNYSQDCE